MDWVLLGHLKPENQGKTLQTVWDFLRISFKTNYRSCCQLGFLENSDDQETMVPPPVINGLIMVNYNIL